MANRSISGFILVFAATITAEFFLTSTLAEPSVEEYLDNGIIPHYFYSFGGSLQQRQLRNTNCDDSSKTNPLDIVFLLDGSSSIREENFARVLQFVASVVQGLNTASSSTHVGVVQFNGHETTEFHLNSFEDGKSSNMTDAISRITYLSGVTMTGKAIRYVIDNEFTARNGDREDVPNVLIVVTDGRAQDDIISAVSQSRASGCEIVAVGVTPLIDSQQLLQLADNRKDYIFTTLSFEDLDDIVDRIIALLHGNRFCGSSASGNLIDGEAVPVDSSGIRGLRSSEMQQQRPDDRPEQTAQHQPAAVESSPTLTSAPASVNYEQTTNSPSMSEVYTPASITTVSHIEQGPPVSEASPSTSPPALSPPAAVAVQVSTNEPPTSEAHPPSFTPVVTTGAAVTNPYAPPPLANVSPEQPSPGVSVSTVSAPITTTVPSAVTTVATQTSGATPPTLPTTEVNQAQQQGPPSSAQLPASTLSVSPPSTAPTSLQTVVVTEPAPSTATSVVLSTVASSSVAVPSILFTEASTIASQQPSSRGTVELFTSTAPQSAVVSTISPEAPTVHQTYPHFIRPESTSPTTPSPYVPIVSASSSEPIKVSSPVATSPVFATPTATVSSPLAMLSESTTAQIPSFVSSAVTTTANVPPPVSSVPTATPPALESTTSISSRMFSESTAASTASVSLSSVTISETVSTKKPSEATISTESPYGSTSIVTAQPSLPFVTQIVALTNATTLPGKPSPTTIGTVPIQLSSIQNATSIMLTTKQQQSISTSPSTFSIVPSSTVSSYLPANATLPATSARPNLTSTVKPIEPLTTSSRALYVSPNVSSLSTGRSNFTITTAAPPTAANFSNIGVSANGDVQIDCNNEYVIVTAKTQKPFYGKVYVKDHFNDPNCRGDYHNATDVTTVTICIDFSKCDVQRSRSVSPPGIEVSVTVVYMFHPQFETEIDRAYKIECFYVEQQKAVTQFIDVEELTTVGTLVGKVEAPACEYSIRSGSANGPILRVSKIGASVYHRWECEEPQGAAGMYGMKVHSCFAKSSRNESVLLLDEMGCAVDRYIFPNLIYGENHTLLAFVATEAFRFGESDDIFFECQIALCIREAGGCDNFTPPKCIHPQKGRKRSVEEDDYDYDSINRDPEEVGRQQIALRSYRMSILEDQIDEPIHNAFEARDLGPSSRAINGVCLSPVFISTIFALVIVTATSLTIFACTVLRRARRFGTKTGAIRLSSIDLNANDGTM